MTTEAWTDGLDLFRSIGATVVLIEDFEPKTVWVRDCEVLLIASDLTTEDRREIAETYVPHILAQRDERAGGQ